MNSREVSLFPDSYINSRIAMHLSWKFDGLDTWVSPEGVETQMLYGTKDKYGDDVIPPFCEKASLVVDWLAKQNDATWYLYRAHLLSIIMPNLPSQFRQASYLVERALFVATEREKAEAFLLTLEEIGQYPKEPETPTSSGPDHKFQSYPVLEDESQEFCIVCERRRSEH